MQTDARKQIERALNEVEDEMTNIPYDPKHWQSDGRMYPPQDDSMRLTGNQSVMCFRSRGHRTHIGQNGAIEIREIPDRFVFSKPGSDAKTIANLLG